MQVRSSLRESGIDMRRLVGLLIVMVASAGQLTAGADVTDELRARGPHEGATATSEFIRQPVSPRVGELRSVLPVPADFGIEAIRLFGPAASGPVCPGVPVRGPSPEATARRSMLVGGFKRGVTVATQVLEYRNRSVASRALRVWFEQLTVSCSSVRERIDVDGDGVVTVVFRAREMPSPVEGLGHEQAAVRSTIIVRGEPFGRELFSDARSVVIRTGRQLIFVEVAPLALVDIAPEPPIRWLRFAADLIHDRLADLPSPTD